MLLKYIILGFSIQNFSVAAWKSVFLYPVKVNELTRCYITDDFYVCCRYTIANPFGDYSVRMLRVILMDKMGCVYKASNLRFYCETLIPLCELVACLLRKALVPSVLLTANLRGSLFFLRYLQSAKFGNVGWIHKHLWQPLSNPHDMFNDTWTLQTQSWVLSEY